MTDVKWLRYYAKEHVEPKFLKKQISEIATRYKAMERALKDGTYIILPKIGVKALDMFDGGLIKNRGWTQDAVDFACFLKVVQSRIARRALGVKP